MTLAFIPVRGGSKSIPLKNIKEICGKPLVYWTVKAACECNHIDKVCVATDSEVIRNAIEVFCNAESGFAKAEVVERSKESATDTASTEFAMLEFAQNRDFENIVLIQATSPMLTAKDLDGGFELFEQADTDSVISAVRQYQFIWQLEKSGNVVPQNYDVYNRPRRQDFDGYLVENGAFYITSRRNLLSSKNRVSGNIKAYEMNADSVFEIDEPSDWIIIESLMKKNGMVDNRKNLPNIKMFLTDCDGCLTDGGMYYSEHGDELKKFNTKDGMAFRLLHEHGIITGILTGEDRKLNKNRAKKMGVDIIKQGVKDKLSVVKALSTQYNVPPEQIAYIGDDINDIEVLKTVGFGCSVLNGTDEAKNASKYITKKAGGTGAIREVVDLILLG